MTTLQKIKDIEDEMAKTQKNKATSGHLGGLKAKLAKLKRELISDAAGGKAGGGGGDGFDVNKAGDARVGLVGFPSVGKSTLLNVLTGSFSECAAYEFTTLTCIPGEIVYRGAKIQLLDLPGIIEGAKDGKGRGRQVIGTARTCDLILIVLDVTKPFTHKKIIENELEGFGIRLNKSPPDIKVRRRERGGITWTSSTNLTQISGEEIKAICSEYRVSCADISFRCDASAEDLIDVIEGNRVYTRCLYVMNKIDCITIAELDIVAQLPHQVPISSRDEWNLDELLARIFEYLNLTRIYTKPKGQIPDYNQPVVIRDGRTPTVEAFVERIHRGLLKQFKHALVWGTSTKYNPQRCGLAHVLHDEDVVQIIKKV